MEKENLSELTNQQLLVKKKELKKSKILHATVIGFLAGVVMVAIVASIKTSNFIILIPQIFPVYFIFRLVSNSKKNRELEEILKERELD